MRKEWLANLKVPTMRQINLGMRQDLAFRTQFPSYIALESRKGRHSRIEALDHIVLWANLLAYPTEYT